MELDIAAMKGLQCSEGGQGGGQRGGEAIMKGLHLMYKGIQHGVSSGERLTDVLRLCVAGFLIGFAGALIFFFLPP